VIADRVAAGQTGASGSGAPWPPWRGGRARPAATGLSGPLLERYLELQAGGDPVHSWPVHG
jgi:hypothetical protein